MENPKKLSQNTNIKTSFVKENNPLPSDLIFLRLPQPPQVKIEESQVHPRYFSTDFQNSQLSAPTLITFKGHSDIVTCLGFLDFSRVITGGGDRTLRIWEIERGYELGMI